MLRKHDHFAFHGNQNSSIISKGYKPYHLICCREAISPMKNKNAPLTLFALLPFILLNAGEVYAVETPASDSEAAELERLLLILDEQTDIATKTKLNADYVPGMVTVLDGASVASKGARTVWDALALVPGIETAIDPIGRKQIVVRGVGRTYASGNVKLLLNNVALNKASDGLATPVYNIPISIVDRIEVVRGPGSAIHGEYAYVGVINVITHTDENRITTVMGSNQDRGISLTSAYGKPGDPWQFSLSLSDTSSDGSDFTVEQDVATTDPFAASSNAPGPINDVQASQSAIMQVRYKNTHFSYQHLSNGFGDYYGRINNLPPEERIVTQLDFDAIELKQDFYFGDKVITNLELGQVRSRIAKDHQFLWNAGYFGGYYSDAVYNNSDAIEKRRHVNIEVHYTPNDSHTILLGAQRVKSEMVDISNSFNIDAFGSTPYFVPSELPFHEDSNQLMRSFLVQDEYQLTEDITITAGLRHDRYNNSHNSTGNSNNPRLAAVWRASDRHIYKLQVAKAFRPPTFLESSNQDTSAGDIKPETVLTSELGYIYKSNNNEAKVTFFKSDMHDLIIRDPLSDLYSNRDEASLVGTEFEFESRLNQYVKFDANLSYIETEDKTTGEDIPGSTNVLSNIGLSIKPIHNMLVVLQHRRVGDFNRAPGDDREDLEGYYFTNLTFNISNPDSKSIDVKLGIKNIEDKHYAYPAPPGTYPNEYEYGERSYWGQVSFKH